LCAKLILFFWYTQNNFENAWFEKYCLGKWILLVENAAGKKLM